MASVLTAMAAMHTERKQRTHKQKKNTDTAHKPRRYSTSGATLARRSCGHVLRSICCQQVPDTSSTAVLHLPAAGSLGAGRRPAACWRFNASQEGCRASQLCATAAAPKTWDPKSAPGAAQSTAWQQRSAPSTIIICSQTAQRTKHNCKVETRVLYSARSHLPGSPARRSTHRAPPAPLFLPSFHPPSLRRHTM
jgi:hypothetical protein